VTIPDLVTIGLYSASLLVAAIAGLELSGFFPVDARPDPLRRANGHILIALLSLMSVALAAAALTMAARALPWTIIVIAGGLAMLLAPMGFELVPRQFWDSRSGVVVMTGATSGLLLLLQLNS